MSSVFFLWIVCHFGPYTETPFVMLESMNYVPFLFCQIAYYTECFKIYAELAAQLEPKETIQSDEDFEMDLHQRLCDIRALSIVVDD